MSRNPIKRYNKEFRVLFDGVVATLQDERAPIASAIKSTSKTLGVSIDTIKSWLKPEGGNSACACPKWRVDMLAAAVDPKISGLTAGERRTTMIQLAALRDAGVMSKGTAAAFKRLEG